MFYIEYTWIIWEKWSTDPIYIAEIIYIVLIHKNKMLKKRFKQLNYYFWDASLPKTLTAASHTPVLPYAWEIFHDQSKNTS